MSMADVISKRRKEKGMTQKQLANFLGVTDKAVSKWERCNGYPDISYLEPLAEALEVTVSELLKGKTEDNTQNIVEDDDEELIVKKTLDYANSVYEVRSKNIPRFLMFSVLVLGLSGIITTAIVDFALNRSFTWSLIPISAIIYLWLCMAPLFFCKKHKLDISLLSTSFFLLPFLYVISKFTGGSWFVSIAIPISIAGIIILWAIRSVFAMKLSIWNKLAICALIAAVANVVIAFILKNALNGNGFDAWNLISVAILIVIAIIMFIIGQTQKNR